MANIRVALRRSRALAALLYSVGPLDVASSPLAFFSLPRLEKYSAESCTRLAHSIRLPLPLRLCCLPLPPSSQPGCRRIAPRD